MVLLSVSTGHKHSRSQKARETDVSNSYVTESRNMSYGYHNLTGVLKGNIISLLGGILHQIAVSLLKHI